MARHGRGIMQSEMERKKQDIVPEVVPLKGWQKAVAARMAKRAARKSAMELLEEMSDGTVDSENFQG